MANNPLDMYNSFSNSTQIKFLHGSQAGINTMINEGTAIEGAFYLADDTQKLYVGRRDSANNSKVYPVQVSRGVTIVANTSDLPINLNASVTHADAASWAIEEGELYYITDSNILAALRANSNSSTGYEWVQVNPPTGLERLNFSAAPNTIDNTEVIASTLEIYTQANPRVPVTATKLFVGGNNVNITNNTIVDRTQNPAQSYSAIEISAVDTQYAIAGNTTTNGALLGLSKDNSVNLDSNISLISQSNSIAIEYNDTSNAIEFKGPTLDSVVVTNDAVNGFEIAVLANYGRGSAQEGRKAGLIQPEISYGKTGDKSLQHFISGVADLNVYTVEQTDNAITAAITSKLQTAEALSYKGTVNFDQIGTNAATYFSTKKAFTGDVYKVVLNANETITIKGEKVKNGDLIIFNGGSQYPSEIDTSEFLDPSTVYQYIDVVPTGNETELQVSLNPRGAGDGTTLKFLDVVRGTGLSATEIYSADILEGDLISIDSNSTSLTISHDTPTIKADANNVLVSNVNEEATFGKSTYKFFALAPNIAEAIERDEFGHVVGIQGKEIVFKHNRLESLATSYMNQSSYINSTHISIDAEDSLGQLGKTASIDIMSNTLKFTSSNETGNQHFAIDLVWETFDNN